MGPDGRTAAEREADREAKREERRVAQTAKLKTAIERVETEMSYGGEATLTGAKALTLLLEREAALLGLDAPKRQELTGANGAPIEIDARQVLLAQLTAVAVKLVPAGAAMGGGMLGSARDVVVELEEISKRPAVGNS